MKKFITKFISVALAVCCATVCFMGCEKNDADKSPATATGTADSTAASESSSDETAGVYVEPQVNADGKEFYGTYSEGGNSDLVDLYNAMYENFSVAEDTENPLVVKFGNEPCYYWWLAEKVEWMGDNLIKESLKNKIVLFPQTDSGYMWSWSTSTYWPTGTGSMHYDGTLSYVSAVWKITEFENSTELLDEKDRDQSETTPEFDASKGKTVYEKCKLCMDYAINSLNGSEGAIRITEQSVYLADGKTRFDVKDGKNIWNNTGCVGSKPSNYWDNLCFGNLDAYETILFYRALESMANIEKFLGHEDEAKKYEDLMPVVYEKFNELFWSEETGRYIGCIDTKGNKYDFGFTFLNTEALCAGLGDAEKAELIFDWIDGKRTVSTDTVKGRNILNYSNLINKSGSGSVSSGLYLAPISNTVDIASYNENGVYWWEDLGGAISCTGNAAYGKHLENGGYIFYTVYAELMARAEYLGLDSVNNRITQIIKTWKETGLKTDYGGWLEGLVGEYPESGLVLATYLEIFLGITSKNGNICISPNLPEGYEALGLKAFEIDKKSYNVNVSKTGVVIKCEEDNFMHGVEYTCTDATTVNVAYYGDGETPASQEILEANEDGVFIISAEKLSGVKKVVIYR